MNAEFFAAVEDIEKEKGIPREYMYEKIEQALMAAFRKDNPDYGENVEVVCDEAKKRIELLTHMTVVETRRRPHLRDRPRDRAQVLQEGRHRRRARRPRWRPASSGA